MCETVFIPAPKNQNPQKPVHTPRQLSQPPATHSKQTTSLRPAQSAHLFRPPAVLALGRVTQLTRHLGRAAQPASVTRLCLIGVYPCSSAAKQPLPAPLNPLSRPKLALFGRKGNYGYSQSDTGEPKQCEEIYRPPNFRGQGRRPLQCPRPRPARRIRSHPRRRPVEIRPTPGAALRRLDAPGRHGKIPGRTNRRQSVEIGPHRPLRGQDP